MGNHERVEPGIQKARRVLQDQTCCICGTGDAGYLIYMKDGSREATARTARKSLEALTCDELVAEGFTCLGYIHSNRKYPTCLEDALAAKPPHDARQLVSRQSEGLKGLFAAQNAAKERKAALALIWTRPLPGASKSNLKADVPEIVSPPVEAVPEPVAVVVETETPPTTEQIENSPLSGLRGLFPL